MDNQKIGSLIYQLRKERGLTQLALAEQLHISDKTISKWERGQGCPDVSLLTDLSRLFGVELEKLLDGDLTTNQIWRGNMKKLNFYICPDCGNVITSTTAATIACCGKHLPALTPVKAEEKLNVELIENEYFVSSDHEMTRDHYISFVALLTGDTLILRKQYPEWDLQTRLPRIAHGKLIWYCTKHGLFEQIV